MSGLARVACLTAAMTAGSTALADDLPPGLVCRVEGYDLALINTGATPVAAGTVIGWSVPFARADGRHDFDAPLPSGGMVMLGGVLESSYLRPGTPCHLAPGDDDP
ncbi:hypothetical protein [Roseicyclus mahoneyensis]|jgi:hypothetical protein|uniref:Uncharacterized protein n=1 Tax=Roseicyclus mahoneyensis TaxID=164332 RepID=A0A316GQS8_9RHOB|nr:hypothetical protein [Roseicyclus mahoneyensis]PWK62382.1 hypothetical protein C7455_101408 [Roseicyclus mahoneyensis]